MWDTHSHIHMQNTNNFEGGRGGETFLSRRMREFWSRFGLAPFGDRIRYLADKTASFRRLLTKADAVSCE